MDKPQIWFDESLPKTRTISGVDVPYFVKEHRFIGGIELMRAPVKDVSKPDAKGRFGCHPETWAAMPDDVKARFDVVERNNG